MKWSDWSNDQFAAAMERLLMEIEGYCKGMQYPDSEREIRKIRERFNQRAEISEIEMDKFAAILNNEIQLDRHPTMFFASEILKEVLSESSKVAKKKGKPLDVSVNLTSRMKKIDETLGPVFEQIQFLIKQGSSYYRAAAYLTLLGFEIRWEIQGDFIKRRLKELSKKAFSRNPKKQDELINKYLSIWGLGTDGKPDSIHLRNAIAHGWFFTKKDIVYFRVRDKTGALVFEDSKTIPEIIDEMNNVAEKKLLLLALILNWIKLIVTAEKSPFKVK